MKGIILAGFIGSNFVPYFLEKYLWKADENFDTGIVKTIEWYLEKYNG